MIPTIPLAFLAGLAAFFSPCVFPLVPSYLGYVTGLTLDELRGAANSSPRNTAALHAVLFGAGFTIVFVALGLAAGAIGLLLFDGLRVLQLVGAFAIILLGVQLLGLIRIPWLMRTHARLAAPSGGGKLATIGAGVTFGAAWTPCVGPLLASILLYAGMSGHMLRAAALLTAFAAGLGVPFLVSAVAFNRYLVSTAHIRPLLRWVERSAGAVLIASGILLLLPAAAERPAAAVLVPYDVPIADTVYTGDHTRGATNAEVHVIAFTDFTCAYCREFALETYPLLDGEFVRAGRVRWTTVVTAQPWAAAAAEAAMVAACAAQQDETRFWRLYDLVFEHQSEWRKAADRRRLLLRYASQAGAETAQLEKCLAAPTGALALAEANRRADALRVRMRPTFFVNGVRLEGAVSLIEFRRILNSAIEEAT